MSKKPSKPLLPDPLDILVAGVITASLGIGLSFGLGAALIGVGLGAILVGFILASTPAAR